MRLELETRKERADLITRDILSQHPDQWPALAIGHLRDFIDLDTQAWAKFVQEKGRANAKLVNAREVSLSKMTEWLLEQVSPTLSVVVDVIGEDVPLALIRRDIRSAARNTKPYWK